MKTIFTILFFISTSVGNLFAQENGKSGITHWAEKGEIEVSNKIAKRSESDVRSKHDNQNEEPKVFSPKTTKEKIKLSFIDGRKDVIGLVDINAVLQTVGVRVSAVELPAKAKPILETSKQEP